MSKKRQREVKATDTKLIEIYDDLANDDEEIRLKAAYALLSRFSANTTIDQHKNILKRLFRGLCSGRKAARLGFSVALTEFLSQVILAYIDGEEIEVLEIVDLLESQTAVDGSTSGQDERDHYFGRLFGAEAIVKSSILFPSEQRLKHWAIKAWERLVEIICGIATKKPWLREQCGWLFCSCMKSLSNEFNHYVIDALGRYKLLRTPEGVAVWLSQQRSNAKELRFRTSWKHGSPLSKKGVSTLAEIMKDAKPQQADSDSNLDSQGKAMWSPQLHFSWDLVLQELYQDKQISEDRVSFKDFWLTVVDQGLFISSSSVERKHWGLLLLAKVFLEAPENAIANIVTPNAVMCLQNQLKADSRYLQRSAQKALTAMHARVARQNELALVVLRGMLVDAGALQFDVSTRTKTLEKLITVNDNRDVFNFLRELYQHPRVEKTHEATNARKILTDLLVAACSHELPQDHKFPNATKHPSEESQSINSRYPMEILIQIGLFVRPAIPEVTPGSRQYVKERIMACLEQALKTKVFGRTLLRHTVVSISVFESQKLQPAYEFDTNIKAIIKDGHRRLSAIQGSLSVDQNSRLRMQDESEFSLEQSSDKDGDVVKHVSRGETADRTDGDGTADGLILLYHLALLQVYSGEAEAVTIVEDLNAYHDKMAEEVDAFMDADVLVEVLLSFASKPSKFLRKIGLQAFASFAVQITQEGLQSLIRVLETKENLQGQEEMFDAEEPAEDAVNGITGDTSDVGVDSGEDDISDIEGRRSDQDSEPNADADDDGFGEGEEGEEEEEEVKEDDDDELAAFDAMLAAALGTRKGEDDLAASDTSGSDDDMSDSEMEALDEKLTEVFRARKDAMKPKKKEHRDARETIVNFKNRVLDLVEVYLKQEHANALSLQLLIPLLALARRTNTKQLADRACSLLRDFNGRCRGAKMPDLTSTGDDKDAALSIFEAIHLEAGLGGSNAHAAACSSASILLVRVLSHAGVRAGTLWAVYAATGTRMLEDAECRVQPSFFTDWNNWCANARKTVAR